MSRKPQREFMTDVVSLTKDELLALLKAAKEHSERDWLLLLVSFNHGLRESETLSLTPANFKSGYLTIQRLKGSLKTTQALVEHDNPLLNEKAGLNEYLKALGPKQRLFPITRFGFIYVMRRHCETAGIPAHKATPHKLKHTAAMLSISQGIEHVRARLGHKSIASTGAYLRVSQEAAGAAFERALAGM